MGIKTNMNNDIQDALQTKLNEIKVDQELSQFLIEHVDASLEDIAQETKRLKEKYGLETDKE